MTDQELVVVRTFGDRFQADMAQSALEAAAIESMVRSDDTGGLRPHLAFVNGVELLVRADDANAARAILDAAASE